ncbi:hypothetical protein BC831DRAFT_67049 [Entophlyctis helioformis]|nr:hypothetical protein BC831DRAFT_67049 [Entophlyctis helioformis]
MSTAQSAPRRLRDEPLLSTAEAEALRKELNDQEVLIRGYQTENEKLTEKVKMLVREAKEAEQRFYLKHEALVRENQALRSQVLGAGRTGDVSVERAVAAGPEGDAAPGVADTPAVAGVLGDFAAARSQVRIERLEAELATLRHTAKTRETDLRARISQLEAQLGDAQTSLESLQGADPERLKKLEAEHKVAREKYETYIVELEGRVERYAEVQEMLSDAVRSMETQESVIRDLRAALSKAERDVAVLESLHSASDKTAVDGRKGVKPGTATAAASVKRVPADVRRIKDLEREVESLREETQRLVAARQQLMLRSPGLLVSEVVSAPRPVIDDLDYMRHLKQRVRKLERDYETAVEESQHATRTAQDEMKRMQVHYERQIQELEICVADLQAATAEDARQAQRRAEAEAASHIRSHEQGLKPPTTRQSPPQPVERPQHGRETTQWQQQWQTALKRYQPKHHATATSHCTSDSWSSTVLSTTNRHASKTLCSPAN